MNIDLNRQELYKILTDKFGNASFRLIFEESDKSWEERTNQKVSELEKAPKKESYTLHIDK